MSTPEVIKKNQERLFAQWFLQQIECDACEIFDCESPDFVLKTPDNKIGLEVTQLYKDETENGSLIKGKEARNEKWLAEVANQYYSISATPLHVKVLAMSGEPDYNKPLILAEALVENNDISVQEEKVLQLNLTNRFKLKVWLKRLPENFNQYKRWTFINNHVGFSREIDEDLIQDKINNKATKLPAYRKKYNQTILLIIVNRIFKSGMFHNVPDDSIFDGCGFLYVYLGLYPDRVYKLAHKTDIG
ncbi:MAG: hypothetical protein AB1814_04880 [Thermodesulfobacteriota bacterium]